MSHKSQTTNPFFAFIMGGDPCYPALLPLPSQPLAQTQKVVSFHQAVTLGSKKSMGSSSNFCIPKTTVIQNIIWKKKIFLGLRMKEYH